MKLLFQPFSIAFGIIGARAGKRAFATLWSRISDSAKPSPKEPEVGLLRLASSAALEGATLAATSAIAAQLSVRLFHHLFGVWPVKSKQEPTSEPA